MILFLAFILVAIIREERKPCITKSEEIRNVAGYCLAALFAVVIIVHLVSLY